jgi:hypothetical protein
MEIQEYFDGGKSRSFVTVGKGKAYHVWNGAETLCNKAEGSYLAPADVLDYNPCKTCFNRLDKLTAEQGATAEDKGENIVTERNDVTTEQGTAVIEQIDANIERALSLAEAENAEGLDELYHETEALISTLSGKGSIAIKKEKRDAWTANAMAAPKAELKKVTEGVVVAKTWDQYEGVEALVNEGAELIGKGVEAHVKISHLAKDVAALVFDMWTKIPNKDGNPDLMGASDPAKKGSGEMLRRAGKGFEDNFDNKQALKKLTRSVQDQRSDVRAEWLRSLDEDTELGAQRREIMAKVLTDKPEDTDASAWVADKYGASLLGQTERKRLEYAAKAEAKELESGAGEGGEGEGEGAEEAEATTPDERVTGVAKKLLTDISRAKVEDFEAATEETKETVREELEKAMKALKAMIAATL